jgi:hypothetical protein
MSGADMFGIDEEEVKSINEALAGNPRRNDRRICVCGHSFSRHDAETNVCNPVSFECACKRKHPILEVKNTRYFIARSIGSGEGHALVRGYMASKDAIENFDESVKWIAELKCENNKCGKPTKLYPVRTDEYGYRLYDSDDDRGINAILCEDCRAVYWDSDEAQTVRRANIKAVN